MRIRGTRLGRGVRRSAVIAVLATLLWVAPHGAANNATLPPELPVVTLDRVLPRSGNNPFDPRDPMAAIAGRGTR